ncbi:lysophospholipid acyltransferase LPEAT1-like isoform X1 [Papaver somniferum]|uniref:lysophospholipid acyltransferase LPEAT1-like isoform X1 n=1 Tax=Papaver somniferum TaxID=3469 RepID=UPI000E7000DF|nr:lysophospholipid acyltransferase LPEAT1-like isoform X1 [Papaver somniferum]
MEAELKDITNLNKSQNSQREEGKEKDNQPLLQKSEAGDSDNNISYTEKDIQELEKKFAAYVRNDVYGTMGLGEISLKEKILLGLAMITLLPIRLIVTVAILTFYYLVCRLCTLFSAPNREEGEDGQEDYAHLIGWRRNVIVAFGRFCSRAILFANGFYWITETYVEKLANEDQKKGPSEESERPGAIISNHVSYLDILYHMSSSFPSFVAKRSVAKLPLVGLISKCLGCVYVQRESKSAEFKGVAGVVTDRIVEAHQNEHAPLMLLFPEGTTTNGDFLLPFKTGAFIAKAPVLPVILRYPYQRFSPAWDTISGVRHIVLLLCQFVNHIEVVRLPVYHPSEQEKEDPKLYASNVRKLLATEGKLTLADIGLAEKRVYHAALNGNNNKPSVLHHKDD